MGRRPISAATGEAGACCPWSEAVEMAARTSAAEKAEDQRAMHDLRFGLVEAEILRATAFQSQAQGSIRMSGSRHNDGPSQRCRGPVGATHGDARHDTGPSSALGLETRGCRDNKARLRGLPSFP